MDANGALGGVVSGHWFSQLIDLLLATWSLSLNATVVALLGSFALVPMLGGVLDASRSGAGHDPTSARSSDDGGSERLSRLEVVRLLVGEPRLGLRPEQAERLFSLTDEEGCGTLGQRQLERLVRTLEVAMQQSHTDRQQRQRHEVGQDEAAPNVTAACSTSSTAKVSDDADEAKARHEQVASLDESINRVVDAKLRGLIPELASAVAAQVAARQREMNSSPSRSRGIMQKSRPPRLQRAGSGRDAPSPNAGIGGPGAKTGTGAAASASRREQVAQGAPSCSTATPSNLPMLARVLGEPGGAGAAAGAPQGEGVARAEAQLELEANGAAVGSPLSTATPCAGEVSRTSRLQC